MQCALASANAFFSDDVLYENCMHPYSLLPVTRTSQYERHFVCVSSTFAFVASLPFSDFTDFAGGGDGGDGDAGLFFSLTFLLAFFGGVAISSSDSSFSSF